MLLNSESEESGDLLSSKFTAELFFVAFNSTQFS